MQQHLLFFYLLSSISYSKSYPYLYHDRLNRVSDYTSNGNISLISSPHCPSKNSTTTMEKICIANSPNNTFDGEYKYLYQNNNGSIFTNKHTKHSIYPYITSNGDYILQIQTYDKITPTMARCNISNHINNISYCNDKWEVLNNTQWITDTNILSRNCQDICIDNNDRSFIINGSLATFSHFNASRRTNIYECKDCGDNGGFVYGWIYDNGDYYWLIGEHYNKKSAWSVCYVGNSLGNEYIFDINDCFDAGKWRTYNTEKVAWIDDDDMNIFKCNYNVAEEICIEMKSDSEMIKTFTVNGGYENFAVGFDMNLLSLNDGVFSMEYMCDDIDYEELTEFSYYSLNYDNNIVSNIVYHLPSESCDDASMISIKVKVSDGSMNNTVYIDDLYLYHSVDNIIFEDSMQTDTNWDTSGSVTFGVISNKLMGFSNISDGEAYRLYTPFPTSNDVSFITTTIDINIDEYIYTDFNLEWSLITNGLSNMTTINVEIQCDDDEYLNDLCILKTYNGINDCVDSLCYFQSYRLPSECDISSEIMITFYYQSSVSTDEALIDFVALTHSDWNGAEPISCKVKTPSPTQSPTDIPKIDSITTQIGGEGIETDKIQIGHKYQKPFWAVFGGLIFIVILTFILSQFIGNDFYRLSTHIISTIFIIDAYTDILFSLFIKDSGHLYVLWVLCIVFIVFPVIFSLFQLTKAIKGWKALNQDLNEWFKWNTVSIYLLSLITASSFNGIYLGISNIFNNAPFNVPISIKQLSIFHTQRRYSIVLFQNVPQFIFQIVYISKWDKYGLDEIVYISMTFTIISVILNVILTLYQKQYIHKVIDNVTIEFEVGDDDLTDYWQHQNKTHLIRLNIAKLVELHQKLIIIRRPDILVTGLRLHIDIDISSMHHKKQDNDGDESDDEYHSEEEDEEKREEKIKDIVMDTANIIYNAQQKDKIAEIIMKAWKLKKSPNITNIKVYRINGNNDNTSDRKTTIVPLNSMDKVKSEESFGTSTADPFKPTSVDTMDQHNNTTNMGYSALIPIIPDIIDERHTTTTTTKKMGYNALQSITPEHDNQEITVKDLKVNRENNKEKNIDNRDSDNSENVAMIHHEVRINDDNDNNDDDKVGNAIIDALDANKPPIGIDDLVDELEFSD